MVVNEMGILSQGKHIANHHHDKRFKYLTVCRLYLNNAGEKIKNLEQTIKRAWGKATASPKDAPSRARFNTARSPSRYS